MTIREVHEWERAVVSLLNFDDWDLTWAGGGYQHYDAYGKTSKGKDCVVEMKFRTTYYETKMIEKFKYEKLMDMPSDIVKLYFVNDPKANYLFWLNDIQLPTVEKRYCPSTTLWSKQKEIKEVYLLKENIASRINWND